MYGMVHIKFTKNRQHCQGVFFLLIPKVSKLEDKCKWFTIKKISKQRERCKYNLNSHELANFD